MPGKQNNRRVYPDATRQPFHQDKFRKDEAKERQAYYDTLTPQQKLEALDAKLGVGIGAVRQRIRLGERRMLLGEVAMSTEAQRERARRLQAQIDAQTSKSEKPAQPGTPREFTDRAANEARERALAERNERSSDDA